MKEPNIEIETSPLAESPFRFMLPLFLGIAALMGIISILTGIGTARNLANEVPLSGTVIDMTVRMDENGNEYFYPVVAVVMPDGQTRAVQSAEGSWPPAHTVGDAVTLLYNPEHPASARIQTVGGNFIQWTWSIVTGFLAIAFFLASMLAGWVNRNVKPQAEMVE